jgi:CHAT domain-containing protein
LHAAGIYEGKTQECCSDYLVSSYTPTLAALLRAQENLNPLATCDVKLALVAEDSSQDLNLPTLWSVQREIKNIACISKGANLHVDMGCASGSVTTSEVAAAFESANFIHMACHGIQNLSNPLESQFRLSDGEMTVQNLMNLDLNHAFFAFLSACETATGDVKQPDQTIHLAATMLFAGFRSIVATMW